MCVCVCKRERGREGQMERGERETGKERYRGREETGRVGERERGREKETELENGREIPLNTSIPFLSHFLI